MRRSLGAGTAASLRLTGARAFTPSAAFRPGDEAEVLRVNAAAFAHHPEQGSMDAGELAERMAEPWFDPAGLLVADRRGPAAGLPLDEAALRHAGRGVRRRRSTPRRRASGLGKLLVDAGLRHLRDGGADEVLLYVESDNAPAVGLYEGLGFTHAAADTHVMYVRPA